MTSAARLPASTRTGQIRVGTSLPIFRPERPDILTSSDLEEEEVRSIALTLKEIRAPGVVGTDVGWSFVHAIHTVSQMVDMLPYGEVIRYAPDSTEYERAIFIGNLLYKKLTPIAVVQPRNTEEVVQIVDLARTNQIRLTVKNGGHSYAGYCLNDGGIVLDLGAMKNVRINEQSTEVTIEAGCIWKDVYAVLQRKDLANMVVGGQCPTVGVSGFTLGGGCSTFSRSYGLGIDNVIEMTIVTAAGKVVKVRRDDTSPLKKDLFWALCGGGGGNFGILVEFKSRVHQLSDANGQVVCGELTWVLDDKEAQRAYLQMMDTFNTHEWPDELTVDAIWRYNENQQLLGQMTVIYNGDRTQCLEVIDPLLKYNPAGGASDLVEMPWRNWVVVEEGFDHRSKVYHHHSSFIFGSIPSELTKRIIKIMQDSKKLLAGGKGKAHVLWDHIGGATARVGSTDTAFPWRDGLYVANIKVQWNSLDMTKKVIDFMDDCRNQLSPFILKGKAAYINYIDRTLPNWTEAYYDENYPRLQTVKARWDPDEFFRFAQSIRPYTPPTNNGPSVGVDTTELEKFSLPNVAILEGNEDSIYKNLAKARKEWVKQ